MNIDKLGKYFFPVVNIYAHSDGHHYSILLYVGIKNRKRAMGNKEVFILQLTLSLHKYKFDIVKS